MWWRLRWWWLVGPACANRHRHGGRWFTGIQYSFALRNFFHMEMGTSRNASRHWTSEIKASRANTIFFLWVCVCFETHVDRVERHQILDARGQSVIWTNSSRTLRQNVKVRWWHLIWMVTIFDALNKVSIFDYVSSCDSTIPSGAKANERRREEKASGSGKV